MMRKRIIGTMITAAATVLLLVPSQGKAAGVSLGASTFFSWWQPSFEDRAQGKIWNGANGAYATTRNFHIPPAFLLGPSLQLTLPGGFSISSVFLWSRWFHCDFEKYNYNYIGGSLSYLTTKLDISKWDLDVLLNYAASRYLKFFMGFKYQGYYFDQHYITIRILPSVTAPTALSHRYFQSGWGPGAGISLNLHLWGPVFLLTNASALYLYTSARWDRVWVTHEMQVYHTIGFNGTASLACYIEPASVTVSLGFRYQYLHYILWDSLSNDWKYDSTTGVTPITDSMNDDHFYGITLSAVYSLEF
jgi:hypothetical protein